MFVCTEALTWSLLSQDRADTLRQEKERTFERSQSQADAMRTFHWFLMQTDIALYSGDGEQAWSACQQSWDSVRKVELFDAPLVRGLAWYTYGRCALAGAAVCEGNAKQQRIAQAQQAAKRLSKLNKLAFAPGTEGLIRAGIASILGSDPTAITLLERASDHFGSVEMQLHRAVCQRRLAALTGGDEGACLLRESDRWMTSEEVRAPERMANWIAPGAWAR